MNLNSILHNYILKSDQISSPEFYCTVLQLFYFAALCNVPVILARFQLNLNLLDIVLQNTRIKHFIKIRTVGIEPFHAEGRTDRRDKANSLLSQFCETSLKTKRIVKEGQEDTKGRT